MSVHLTPDELADASVGLLDPGRAAEVADHLTTCADCTAEAAALTHVVALLAAEPTPPMPPSVSARLSEVIAAESRRRSEDPAETGEPALPAALRETKPSLGAFGEDLPRTSKPRFLSKIVVAAIAAGLIGVGGYVVSAAAGLNEPRSSAAIAISSSQLPSAASSIRARTDLDAHPFSRAWSCAREATAGRVTGLVPAVIDGTPGLLVYTRPGNDTTRATAVTACNTGTPRVGVSATLPR